MLLRYTAKKSLTRASSTSRALATLGVKHRNFSRGLKEHEVKQENPQEILKRYRTLCLHTFSKPFSSESKKIAFYKSIPEVEGYFVDDYVNFSIYQKAQEIFDEPRSAMETQKALNFLKDKIININDMINTPEYRGPINEIYRYPVPEPAPWLHQDRFLACLKNLEDFIIANDGFDLKRDMAVLASIFPKEHIDFLPMIQGKVISYRGFAMQRLPLTEETNKDFFLTVYNASGEEVYSIAWTEALKLYGRFNVMPSAEFLSKFADVLNVCQKYTEKLEVLNSQLPNIRKNAFLTENHSKNPVINVEEQHTKSFKSR